MNETEALTEIARQMLGIADRSDPGIKAGSTWSANERTRAKYQAIQAHGIAYGIRWTLDMLGLLPDDEPTPTPAPSTGETTGNGR